MRLFVCERTFFFLFRTDSSSSLVFTYLGQHSLLENMHRYKCPFVKHQASAIFLTQVSVCRCQSRARAGLTLSSPCGAVCMRGEAVGNLAFQVNFISGSRRSLSVWDSAAPPFLPQSGLSIKTVRMCCDSMRFSSHQATPANSATRQQFSQKGVLLLQQQMNHP